MDHVRQEKGLLFLCFIIAFLAWQGIRKNIGLEMPVSNISVDVDVPEGWAVWDKSTHHVNILFRGSREDIPYLNSGQLRVVVPVSNPTAGKEIHIRLLEKYLKNPTGARVVRFSPSDLFIRLDRERERLLPVKATTEGVLPEGIEVNKIVCTPASVLVSGAEQVLSDMENIHTGPIRLDGRQTSFKESAPIALPQIGRIGVDPDWVSVDVMLEQHTGLQEFQNIPVKILCESGETRQIELQPKTVTVVVKGQQRRLEQIREADVFAYVNCTELTVNTGYELPVTVNLPPGLQFVRTDPATITIQVEK
jgi:hypothetical protein